MDLVQTFFLVLYIQSAKGGLQTDCAICRSYFVYLLSFAHCGDRIAADARNSLKASFNIVRKHL